MELSSIEKVNYGYVLFYRVGGRITHKKFIGYTKKEVRSIFSQMKKEKKMLDK